MLSDSEILNIVRRESYDAESYVTSEVSYDRENALERYLGEPYGDEVEGRSQICTREVMEAVEWALPSILRVFTGGDDVVEYLPQGPEDEQMAKQATDYANFVFYRENNGFLIFYTWAKDALLSKQGVVKSWWEETTRTKHEEYSGLTDEEYMALIAEDDVEVLAHSAYTIDGVEVIDDDGDDDLGVDEDTGEYEGLPIERVPVFHEVEIERTIKDGQIRTVNVPPEEFYMSRRAADPDFADYLEHRTHKTASDLIREGFDKKTVDGLAGDDSNDPTGERETRMGQTYQDEDHPDPSMREIVVHESYVYMDPKEGGVAERWKVIWAGETVLDKERCDYQPFSIIQPIPIPHRAYGLSFADIVSDLQRIKTVLTRQTLDNLYLANNPEREVDVNKIVSMDDFLMSRPGGIKRVESIGATREISHPFVAQHSFAMLDGVDSMISDRTGISDAVTGVDADVLQNQTATASNNQLAQANQRIEMICRIFAETGVKHLFGLYLKLMVKHQDKPKTIRLRNEWVPMDPRSWNAEMDVTVDVGLGHGNRDQQVNHLMGLLNWQKEMLASGGIPTQEGKIMVRPKHVYNTFEKLIKAVGFKSIDAFMDDPGDAPLYTPEQGDPNAALVQGQMQIENLKAQQRHAEAQLKMETELQKAREQHAHEMHKLQLERERVEVEREKIAAGLQETAAKIDADKEKAAAQLLAEAKKARMEADERANSRIVDLEEKQRDREAQERMARERARKNVRVERGEDGSLSGYVEE